MAARTNLAAAVNDARNDVPLSERRELMPRSPKPSRVLACVNATAHAARRRLVEPAVGHQRDEVSHPTGVAPLIVIPGNDLH